MFEGLLLPWQQIYHLAFYLIFGTTPEVSSKLYFVEIYQVSEKLWLFNHKRADFWLPNFNLNSFHLKNVNYIYTSICSMFYYFGGDLRYE